MLDTNEYTSTNVSLIILQKYWKICCTFSWTMFVLYQTIMGFNKEISYEPICPYDAPHNDIYMYGMCFILGGFIMTLSSIILRFLTITTDDYNKRFLYWISFHIICISTISTSITIFYNLGGTCIDVFGVASSAATWGEWLACCPLIILTIITITNQPKLRILDIVIISSIVFCILTGFFIILVDSYLFGLISFSVAILLSLPSIFIFYFYNNQNEYQNVHLFNQYRKMSICIGCFFPLYIVNYILGFNKIIDYSQTILIYHVLSLITKGLFVSFVMDIHLNILVNIDKALLKEQQANDTRRSFMKYIFHEVRAPLNSVMIGLDFLNENESFTNDGKSTLQSIRTSCLFMNETLNNVINLHKIEEHKWEVEIAPFSLSEMINTIEATFHNLILSKHISFNTTIIPYIIISDYVKIQHVISNLVSNAIKFCSDNGMVNLIIKKDDNNLIIQVKDTGHGILPENQQKLFMNYSQILPHSVRDGSGSGLGLMFCKNIVNLLGGDIYLKSSDIGVGTVFECKIPVKFKHKIIEEHKKETTTLDTIFPKYKLNANKNNINSVIIDDHDASRNILMMYLKKIGMNNVSSAENGMIAYNMISSNLTTHNLLIVDNLMPVMNGVEMTLKLRQIGYPFLIIGLTGNVMDQDMNEFLKAGADYVLMKPLKMKELHHLVTFINQYGFTSKTSKHMKLIYTNDTFEWINMTPIISK